MDMDIGPLLGLWLQSFVPLYVIAMPLTIALLSRTKGSEPEKHEMSFGWLFRNLVMTCAVMFIGNLIGTVLMAILTGGRAQNVLVGYAMDAGNEALKILFIVFLGPLLEELLFRKILIDRTRAFGEKNAILFSALLFGLVHTNMFQFFYAFGIGLIFGYIYVRTGKVLYTWVMHAAINFFYCVIPGWLLRWIRYDEMMELMNDQEKLTAFFQQGDVLAGLIAFSVHVLIFFALVIAGIILLIRSRKKWELAPVAEGASEKALRRNMLLNAGVLGFYGVSAVLTVLLIFQTMGGNSAF